MGIYFNPDNGSFKSDIRSRIYVDKTWMLEELNQLLGTSERCIALSHARRFGKSQAAGMICAYYSLGSDSRDLFAPFEIAKAPDFAEHLNQYHVIHIDVSSVSDFHKDDLVESILNRLYSELQSEISKEINYDQSVNYILDDLFHLTGRQFVIILDEWDCVVRNCSDQPELVHRYLHFLHALFKSEESKSYLAPAYYNVVRELPAGKGFADIALIPRADTKNKPPMIIELKWKQDADTAIRQIKERRYTGALKDFGSDVLLVGVGYDKDSADKKHECVIESRVVSRRRTKTE